MSIYISGSSLRPAKKIHVVWKWISSTYIWQLPQNWLEHFMKCLESYYKILSQRLLHVASKMFMQTHFLLVIMINQRKQVLMIGKQLSSQISLLFFYYTVYFFKPSQPLNRKNRDKNDMIQSQTQSKLIIFHFHYYSFFSLYSSIFKHSFSNLRKPT